MFRKIETSLFLFGDHREEIEAKRDSPEKCLHFKNSSAQWIMDPEMREDDFLLVENEFLLSHFSRRCDLLCSSPDVGHLSSAELFHRLKFVHSNLLFGLCRTEPKSGWQDEIG